MGMAEAQLKEAQAKASWSKDQWFTKWQASEACDDYCAKVGQASHRIGEDEILGRLKVGLADCNTPEFQSRKQKK